MSDTRLRDVLKLGSSIPLPKLSEEEKKMEIMVREFDNAAIQDLNKGCVPRIFYEVTDITVYNNQHEHYNNQENKTFLILCLFSGIIT